MRLAAVLLLSCGLYAAERSYVYPLEGQWKWHEGDNLAWAAPEVPGFLWFGLNCLFQALVGILLAYAVENPLDLRRKPLVHVHGSGIHAAFS